MAPQFNFLKIKNPPELPRHGIPQLLGEVLRCRAYKDKTVITNVLQILTMLDVTDSHLISKMRFLAVVHASYDNESEREEFRKLAEQTQKCKSLLLRREQDLFLQSFYPSADVPTIEKCINKEDLVKCFFSRELKSANWLNIRKLLFSHPSIISLDDNIDKIIHVIKTQKVDSDDVLHVFMNISQVVNRYFLDDSVNLMKLGKACDWKFSECRSTAEGHQSTSGSTFKVKKTFITQEECEKLKNRLDEYVACGKQGFVKSKEYSAVSQKVQEWKNNEKTTKSNKVVVVDALNFGRGRDPVNWNGISSKFTTVKFATRLPPVKIRETVLRKYKGNAVFCDKLSTDDLIIIRMALEYGPQTCIVTNDRYTDHRQAVCQYDTELLRIWDDFMTDAVYRHYSLQIEPRRDYNLRIQNIENKWFVPILERSKDEADERRSIKVLCIETKRV